MVRMIPMIQSIRVPLGAATLAGFRAWATSDSFPRRGRISFIDPEILIDMSPEELETHNAVNTAVHGTLFMLNQQWDAGKLYSDRALVTNEAAGLATEQDGTFVTWSSFESGRVRLVARAGQPGEYLELEGSPDWVLEVVSRSSIPKDTQLLRQRYHHAGIREYWLINALEAAIDFQLLVHRRAGYVAAPRRGGWLRSPVLGRGFRLERRRDRLGLWQDTLEVKPA